MSFDFAPQGWAQCNGQLLPVNQNVALFALLGTMYGGNGQTTFALPDLRGQAPAHVDPSVKQGTAIGEEAHTLLVSEMPAHQHSLQGTSLAVNQPDPTGNLFGSVANLYSSAQNLYPINPQTVSNAGGNQPHQTMQPYLVLNFCIALQGDAASQK